MPALDVAAVVADLDIARMRARRHRQLVLDLAAEHHPTEPHLVAAIEELAAMATLEDRCDDLVRILCNAFPPVPASDEDKAAIVDLEKRSRARGGKS